jgi:hypothetical protein
MPEKQKAPKGQGASINLDLSEHADLLAKIRKAADDDDRPASVWLRRKLIALGEQLFK